MAVMAMTDVDGPGVVAERLEAFAGEVLAEAGALPGGVDRLGRQFL
jgi:hypothetical protein